MLDKAEAIDIAKKYANEVLKVLDVDAIIFFGSFVHGYPHEYSDLNIAVIAEGFEGDWWEMSSLLHTIASGFSCIISPEFFDDLTPNRKGEYIGQGIENGIVLYSKEDAKSKEIVSA